MEIEAIIVAIKAMGLPTALLVSVLVGLYKLGKMLIIVIAKPVADKHIAYLDASIATMGVISEKLDSQNAKLDLAAVAAAAATAAATAVAQEAARRTCGQCPNTIDARKPIG